VQRLPALWTNEKKHIIRKLMSNFRTIFSGRHFLKHNKMNTTKLLLGTLAGGIVYFLLGWLAYGMLFGDTFAPPEGVAKSPMVMWSMIVSCLIWGLLITIVCGRWAGVKTFAGGATVGAIVGLLVSGAVDFSMYSMFNFMTIPGSLGDMAINAVLSGITGGVIGLVLGSGKKG
jgi:hypothetical protein